MVTHRELCIDVEWAVGEEMAMINWAAFFDAYCSLDKTNSLLLYTDAIVSGIVLQKYVA